MTVEDKGYNLKAINRLCSLSHMLNVKAVLLSVICSLFLSLARDYFDSGLDVLHYATPQLSFPPSQFHEYLEGFNRNTLSKNTVSRAFLK